MASGANVTKHDANGSGDNRISDGYICSVQKIWTDTYSFTAAIPSGTTINIAVLPANKKIWGIDVYFDNGSGTATALSTGASGTGTTISLGYHLTTSSATGGSTFLSAGEACAGIYKLSANQGIGTVLAGLSYITLKTDRIATTATTGTIRTEVRYT